MGCEFFHNLLGGEGLSVAAFRGRHRTIIMGDLEFLVVLQILSLPDKGNLERGIFHGTRYTGYNKIRTPPIFRLICVHLRQKRKYRVSLLVDTTHPMVG